MLACVPTSSACQSASMTAQFTCQHACMPAWFTCQRACMLMYQKHANFSFLCANVQIKVPTCHTTCHFFLTQCSNRTNGVPIFQLGMPMYQKTCQVFKQSPYKMLKEISTLYYYIKNSTFYLILQLNIYVYVDDDYVHRQLSGACFFVPRHKKSSIFTL